MKEVLLHPGGNRVDRQQEAPKEAFARVMRARSIPRQNAFPVVLALIACLLLLPSCTKKGSDLVKITGKTVYGEMAIEETAVRALRWEEGRWAEYAETRSGYHGSFVLEVPPGRYRIEANGEIPRGPSMVALKGDTELLDILQGIRRVDRILIELAPVAN